MELDALLFGTGSVVVWALCVCRGTWRSYWDRGLGYMMVLTAITLFLISPLSTDTVGAILHTLTGRWGVDEYAGHMCAIGGTSGAVYHGVMRLEPPQYFARKYERLVVHPVRLSMAALIMLFWQSGATRRSHVHTLMEARPDFWLRGYWVLLCSVLIYMLGYGARAWLTLRHDPHSRVVALFFFWGSVFAIVTCLVRIVNSVWIGSTVSGHPFIWTTGCLATVLFSCGAGRSWAVRNRRISRPGDDLIPDRPAPLQ